MDLVWRRLVAGLVDVVLAIVAFGLIAGAAYGLSDGVVRMNAVRPVTACAPTKTLSADVVAAAIAAAPGHTPSDATVCVDRFMGLETGRHVVLAMAGADARVVFVPLTPAGAVVQPVKLGWLPPVAFILLMALGEGLAGATPGKFALGLRVEGGPARTLARNLIIHSWLLAWLATPWLGAHALQAWLGSDLGGRMGAPYIGLELPLALAVVALAMLILGRPDPLYDRWTGAKVRRA